MTRLLLTAGAARVRPSPIHAGSSLLAVAVVLAIAGVASAQSSIFAFRPKSQAGKTDVVKGRERPIGESVVPKGSDVLGGQLADPRDATIDARDDAIDGVPSDTRDSTIDGRQDVLGGREADPRERTLDRISDVIGGEQVPRDRNTFVPFPYGKPVSPAPTTTPSPLPFFEGIQSVPSSPLLRSEPANPPVTSLRESPAAPPDSSPRVSFVDDAPRGEPLGRSRFGYDPNRSKDDSPVSYEAPKKGVLMRLGIDPSTLQRGDAPSDLLSRLRGNS